jgi:hypothetical protein
MGKGPGHVERAIEAVLIAEPDNAFTVDDLCDRVYRGVNRIEKKHRVSVIRAAKLVAKRRPNFEWWRSEHLGRTLVFYMADNVMSYAMARLKADFLTQYRNNDPRAPWRPETEQELRALLIEGGRNHKYVIPGGAWWNRVELWKAERDGNAENAEKLRAEINRERARLGIEPLSPRDLGRNDEAA